MIKVSSEDVDKIKLYLLTTPKIVYYQMLKRNMYTLLCMIGVLAMSML